MMMIIMDSVSDPCEMKLLMLNIKISEIISHPFETKSGGGNKTREKARDQCLFNRKSIILGGF